MTEHLTFVGLAAGFVAGLLAKRYRWVGESTPHYLNTFIINVALPAMILLKVPALVLDANALVPVASAWLVILVTASLVWLLGRLNNWPATTVGALMLVVPLTNSAYLGLPLLNAFTNDAVVAYGAFYDQFGNFVALAVYAPIVVALSGGDQNAADKPTGTMTLLTGALRRLFTFTPFPVLLVATLLMSADTLPDWSQTPLSLLASVMGPLAAFIVGFSLRFTVPRSLRGPLFTGLLLRLMFAPMLVWGVATLFPVTRDATTASVLQAAMPSMITAGLVGIAAGFSERLIVAMLSLGTLLSVLTLGVLFTILV